MLGPIRESSSAAAMDQDHGRKRPFAVRPCVMGKDALWFSAIRHTVEKQFLYVALKRIRSQRIGKRTATYLVTDNRFLLPPCDLFRTEEHLLQIPQRVEVLLRDALRIFIGRAGAGGTL